MRDVKGICPICAQMRWLGGKGRVCKPCAYTTGVCRLCSHEGKVYVDGLCYCCYQHKRVEKKIQKIQKDLQAKTEYNKHLFDLFVRYISRYRLAYFHSRQARELATLLETKSIEPILCWDQILKLSELYPLYHRNKKDNGCAFFKIGYMLQELGVIGLRREERSYWIEKNLERLPEGVRKEVRLYVVRLKRKKMSDFTIENHLRYLRDFCSWFESLYPDGDVYAISEARVSEYASFLRSRSDKAKFLRDNLLGLRRFYSWLVYCKKISKNPLADIKPPEAEKKIVICPEDQIRQLMKWISSPDSEAEGAFLLSLILFYGFTTQELQKSTLSQKEDRLIIGFERPPRSYGRHFYNRDEALTLPTTPNWFYDLQRRFYGLWLDRYGKVKKNFPCPRLLLPKHHHHTRPLSDKTLNQRIYAATLAAIGVCISPKVLRQTCGHLYSKHGDGFLLSRIGWSPEFAFCYTWLPRKIDAGRPLPKYLRKPQDKIS